MKEKILLGFLAGLFLGPGVDRCVYAAGDPAAGLEKFKACAGCHGASPTAGEAIPKLGGQHPEYIVSALKGYASQERMHPGMQAIAAALSPRDREDLAAYLAKFELKDIPIPESGQPTPIERKLEVCRSCHGEKGHNFTPEVPRLTGQDERYMLQALNDYRNGNRKNKSMGHVVRDLTDRELSEMAEYYASQREGLTVVE